MPIEIKVCSGRELAGCPSCLSQARTKRTCREPCRLVARGFSARTIRCQVVACLVGKSYIPVMIQLVRLHQLPHNLSPHLRERRGARSLLLAPGCRPHLLAPLRKRFRRPAPCPSAKLGNLPCQKPPQSCHLTSQRASILHHFSLAPCPSGCSQ
jgi:hypothetical protein